MKGIFKIIQTAEIKEPDKALRLSINQEGIEELGESIEKVGLINPITVKKADGKYEVIAGHRRFLACKKIDKKDIPCMVYPESYEFSAEAKITENVVREDLSPMEIAAAIDELMKEKKMSINQVHKFVGKSRGWVGEMLKLLEYPPDLQARLHHGNLNVAQARELTEILNEQTRIEYTAEAIKIGASARVCKQWADMWKNAQGIEVTPIDEIANITPEPTIDYTKMSCAMCNQSIDYRKIRSIYVCPNCLVALLEVKENLKNGNLHRNGDDPNGDDRKLGSDGKKDIEAGRENLLNDRDFKKQETL